MTAATAAPRSLFRRAPRRTRGRARPCDALDPAGVLGRRADRRRAAAAPAVGAGMGRARRHQPRRAAPAAPAGAVAGARRRRPRGILPWLLALCAFGTAVAIRASYGYLLGREPCVALLFVLVGVKFLEARSVRDGVLLACLSSFLLVTPFFYSQSLLAAAAALPAVLLIGAALDVLARAPRTAPPAAAAAGRALARAARAHGAAGRCWACRWRWCCSCSSPGWPRRCGGCRPTTPARPACRSGCRRGRSASCRCPTPSRFAWTSTARSRSAALRYWRGPVLSRFDGREWSIQLQRPDSLPVARQRAGDRVHGDAGAALQGLAVRARPAVRAADGRCGHRRSRGRRAAGGADRGAHARPAADRPQPRHAAAALPPVLAAVATAIRRRPRSTRIENLRLPLAGGFSNPRTREFARELRATARRRRRLHRGGARVVHARELRLHAGAAAARRAIRSTTSCSTPAAASASTTPARSSCCCARRGSRRASSPATRAARSIRAAAT